MANVLIGIVGVILFIGLAVAGALYLGQQFQAAANNSRASASIQAVSQISSAANMANVQSGVATGTGTAALNGLVTTNYIKSIPTNPTSDNAAFNPVLVTAAGATTGTAEYVVMPLENNADNVCLAIAKQSGAIASTVNTVPTSGTLPLTPSGCVRMNAALGTLTSGSYIAFSRI